MSAPEQMLVDAERKAITGVADALVAKGGLPAERALAQATIIFPPMKQCILNDLQDARLRRMAIAKQATARQQENHKALHIREDQREQSLTCLWLSKAYVPQSFLDGIGTTFFEGHQ